MCENNTANRICGHSPIFRQDGTVQICYRTSFVLLHYLVINSITPDSVQQALYRNPPAWAVMLQEAHLYDAYLAAEAKGKGAPEYKFCKLVCQEVAHQLAWAASVRKKGGETLLAMVEQGDGQKPRWMWSKSAAEGYQGLLSWFILGRNE